MTKDIFLYSKPGDKTLRMNWPSIDATTQRPTDRPYFDNDCSFWHLKSDVHHWFVDHDVTYDLLWDNDLGFFVRVPEEHAIVVKLIWGFS